MATTQKTKIAVIVEDQRLQDYIVLLLVGEGYEVKPFSTQNDALRSLEKEVVDLIISEFQSPNINGLDICKVLRKNFLYNHIPIFFLIPDAEPLNAARLIYAGADDYIKKSLIEDELFLKVKLNLYRINRQQDINSTTILPGQRVLLQELQKRIELKELFAIAYIGLYKLNEFSYHYGFERAESVIKYASSLMLKALRELGDPADFLAHLPQNDFIYITYPDNADRIANQIIKEFDLGIASFYDEEDKKQGFFTAKNRYGEIQKVPIMRIHIGIATNAYFPLFSPSRIIQIAQEIKDQVQKSAEKSVFMKEERKNYSLS